MLPTPLGWPVGFISVPSWALLSLSPHPHAVLSLALAAGSLLPPRGSWLRPPAQLEPPHLRADLGRSVRALVLPHPVGGPGQRSQRSAPAARSPPLPPAPVGRGMRAASAEGEELRLASPLPSPGGCDRL